MHIPLSTWTAACAILAPVSAFYPYELKSTGGSSGQTRREALPRDPSPLHRYAPRGALTLPIRRAPVRARSKYRIVNSTDPKQANSVAIDQDGTDLSYMVAVTIGSSKEEYYLLLDSAASNTWVMGESCQTNACGKHNTFGPSDSTTLKTGSTIFSVTYGTGSVSGNTISDTVHIGSLSASLTFGLATNVSDEFASYPMDGILGIGRGDTVQGTIEAPQLIDVLSSSSLISAKLYGVHLSRAGDGTNDGELNFGAVNKERFDGDLNWISALDNSNGFWEVAVDDAGADGKMVGLKGKSAIVDTGTSYILMPPDDAVAMHKLIDGYTQSGETFTIPCDTKKAMQVKIGSTTYDISTKDWIGEKSTSGGCTSKIIGRKTFGDNQWLMGDVFLKNVYTAFDFDNKKVGFGVKGGSSQATTSPSASPSAKSTATGESSSPPSSSPTTSSSPMMSSPSSTAPPSTTSSTNPFLPAGASASASASSPASSSGASNPTAAAEGSSSPTQAGKGAGERTGVPAIGIALSVVFIFLSLFI